MVPRSVTSEFVSDDFVLPLHPAQVAIAQAPIDYVQQFLAACRINTIIFDYTPTLPQSPTSIALVLDGDSPRTAPHNSPLFLEPQLRLFVDTRW